MSSTGLHIAHQPLASKVTRLVALLAALALLAAACGSGGSDDSSDAGADSSGADSTDAGSNGSDSSRLGTDVEGGSLAPRRIVSMSPTATEMLFAIGAGDQVLAADEFSNYPPEAPNVAGLSALAPNIESIAEFDPDLVVASDNSFQEELEAVGIEVLVLPAAESLSGSYDQIRQLGRSTDTLEAAEQLITTMSLRVVELMAVSVLQQALAIDEGIIEAGEQLTYFHELDDNLFTATSNTFIGSIYSLLGLENIADQAGEESGFPQLSAEYVLEADPHYIFFADGACCGQTAQTIAERPGWDSLRAVKDGRVIEVDEDIASRWGPRAVDFMDEVLGALYQR